MIKSKSGFTIVELLIVIVVLAILAAISIVAYNGVQERARNAQREQDIKTIAKALEMYYLDEGAYPSTSCTPTPAWRECPSPKKINTAWATTSDGSWSILEHMLVPKYLSSLPKDPSWSVTGSPGIYGGYNYDYVRPGGWCGTSDQMFLLTYRLEGSPQKREVSGECSGTGYTTYSYSQYTVIK